jgi:hypothetical protein
MATDIGISEDNFKSSCCKILSQEELIDLELNWIGKLREQVEFTNKATIHFHIDLRVARKWRSWNKTNRE